MEARIYTDDLNRIIAATKDFCTPESETHRVEQKYIKLEFDAEKSIVTAVAVDGYKLSVEHAVISDCDESFVAYIKPAAKFPNKQYAKISVVKEDDELFVRCKDTIYGFKQPNITTPFDWEKVLPTDQPSLRIGFNARYLLDALKAAKASCGSVFNSPIVLEFTSPLSPVVFKTNGGSDIKFVLPMRIKD